MAGTLPFSDFAKQKGLDPKLPSTDAAYKAYLASLSNAPGKTEAKQAPAKLPEGGRAAPLQSLKSSIDINSILKGIGLPATDNGIPIDYTRISRQNTPVVTALPQQAPALTKEQYASKIGLALTDPTLDKSYSLYLENYRNNPTPGNAGAFKGTNGLNNLMKDPMNQAGMVANPKGVEYGDKGTPLSFEEYTLANGEKDPAVAKQRYKEYLDLFSKPGPAVSGGGGQKLTTAEPPAPSTQESNSIPVAGPLPEEKPKKGLWDTIMDTINTGPVHDIIGLLQNAVEHRTASLQNRRVDFDKDTIIGRDRLERLKEDEQKRQYDWQRQLQELNQQFLAEQALNSQNFQGTEADKQRAAAAALQAASDKAALERTLANRKGETPGTRDPLGLKKVEGMK